MKKGKKIVAIIPARGGSKQIPKKNIKIFAGKPLIAWTIVSALQSKYIDSVIVSTDSRTIADIAKKYGARAPFLRPKKLAGDQSKSIDVIFHALNWLEKNEDDDFDVVVVLQPTSPLRTDKDIDAAIRLFFEKKAQAVISVTEAFTSPLWMNTLPRNGSMGKFLNTRNMSKNRQALKKYFQLNGAVYLGSVKYIKNNNGFYGDRTYAYLMPKERSIDIDDMLEFKIAECIKKSASK